MRYNLLLLLLLFPLSGLFAQSTPISLGPVKELSVDELFRLGIENSLRLQASRIKETIADDREKTSLVARFPDLNVGVSGGYIGQPTIFQQGLSQATHPNSPHWANSYNVELVQPIYQGGKIRYDIKNANIEKNIASLNTENDRAEIKILLLQQYLDLYTLYKQVELFEQNIEESELRLKDIRRMRIEGLVTRNDEIRSELQLTNDKLALREAEDNVVIVSHQLDVVLGLDENLIIQPDTSLLYTSLGILGYDEYVQQSYANHPGLKVARESTEISRNDIRLAQANYLPTLSLYGSNTLARPLSSSMQNVFGNNWNVGLSLSFKLSSLYQNRHRVTETRHQLNFKENAVQQMMQSIRVDVRSACTKHREAVDRIDALLLAVRQAQENYRIVRNRYMNQLSILTDLLDANRLCLEVQLQLTVARIQVIYTYYQLQRTCGNL